MPTVKCPDCATKTRIDAPPDVQKFRFRCPQCRREVTIRVPITNPVAAPIKVAESAPNGPSAAERQIGVKAPPLANPQINEPSAPTDPANVAPAPTDVPTASGPDGAMESPPPSEPQRKKKKRKKPTSDGWWSLVPIKHLPVFVVAGLSALVVCVCHLSILMRVPKQPMVARPEPKAAPPAAPIHRKGSFEDVDREPPGKNETALAAKFFLVESLPNGANLDAAFEERVFAVPAAQPDLATEERPVPERHWELKASFPTLEPTEPRWEIEVLPTPPKDPEHFAADLELQDGQVFVDFGKRFTVLPRLADLDGPFALTPPKQLPDKSLYESKNGVISDPPNALISKRLIKNPQPDYDVIDLRTGKSVGKFPAETNIWEIGGRLSPDGQCFVCEDGLPESYLGQLGRKKRAQQRVLQIWQQGAKNGPRATIDVDHPVVGMRFLSDTQLALLLWPALKKSASEGTLQDKSKRPVVLEFWDVKRATRTNRFVLNGPKGDDVEQFVAAEKRGEFAPIEPAHPVLRQPDEPTMVVSPNRQFLVLNAPMGLWLVDIAQAKVIGTVGLSGAGPPRTSERGEDTYRFFTADLVTFSHDNSEVISLEPYSFPKTDNIGPTFESALVRTEVRTGRRIEAVASGRFIPMRGPTSIVEATPAGILVGLTPLATVARTEANALRKEDTGGFACLDPTRPARIHVRTEMARWRTYGPSLICEVGVERPGKQQANGKESFSRHRCLRASTEATATLQKAIALLTDARSPAPIPVDRPDWSRITVQTPSPPSAWKPLPPPPAADGHSMGRLQLPVKRSALYEQAALPVHHLRVRCDKGTQGKPPGVLKDPDEMRVDSMVMADSRRWELLFYPEGFAANPKDQTEALVLDDDMVTRQYRLELALDVIIQETFEHELRACWSPTLNQLAVTAIPSQGTAVSFYNRAGRRERTLQLTRTPTAVDDLGWIDQSTFYTIAGGHLTVWDLPQCQPRFACTGNYRARVGGVTDAPWLAAAGPRRVDFFDLKTGECLARCPLPFAGEIVDAVISPDGQKLALAAKPKIFEAPVAQLKSGVVDRPTPEEGETTGVVWDLQKGQYAQIPFSLATSDDDKSLTTETKIDPVLAWQDAETIAFADLGAPPYQRAAAMGVDLQKGRLYAHLAAREQRKNSPLDKSIPLAIRVGLPDEGNSQVIANRLALQYARAGQRIGPGGNTLTVTANYHMTETVKSLGIELHLDSLLGPTQALPTVVYQLTYTDATGKVIGKDHAFGRFPGVKSQFFKGKR